MDYTLNIVYFILFFALFVISFIIFLESNIHQVFKKGRILIIRVFYILISLAFSYLVTNAIIKIIEVISKIVTK